MSLIRQIIRGCGTLPGVGPHPGVEAVIGFTAIGALAGVSNDGLPGALFGGGLMLFVFGAFFLWGAYSRAQLSDRISQAENTHD